MSAGPRRPLLPLQDYQLVEKLATNRERIPERVVRAKGSGDYGRLTIASDELGEISPIFGAPYAADLSDKFGVKTISLVGLAALCWQCFGFPLQTWR